MPRKSRRVKPGDLVSLRWGTALNAWKGRDFIPEGADRMLVIDTYRRRKDADRMAVCLVGGVAKHYSQKDLVRLDR